MKKNKIGRGLIATVFAVCLFAVIWVIPGQAAEKQKIRVGYMDYNGFIEEQLDGTYAGYGAEYLSEIAKYTDFEYEYVYGEWSDLMVKLENHEIDFLCTAQYTDERGQKYDYSAYPIGYTQGLLYTTKDNDNLYYEDFTAFNNINVGIIQGNAMITLFEQYEAQNGFTCNLLEYGSEGEMVEALNAGEIDAICSEHLANHTGLSLLAKFGADAYYLISYKDSPYMEDVNFALQEIKADVDYETDLYHKYYDSSTAETTLQFTSEEKAYIDQENIIRVGMQVNREPFSTYNEETGEFTGINVEILKAIAEDSGLIFEFVPEPAGVTTPDLIATGDYDVVCGIERDNFTTNEAIHSTESYLECAIVPVGRTGESLDINGEVTAAIPASFQALQKYLDIYYPSMKVDLYQSNRECLEAVKKGKADIVIQNTHILGQLLQEPQYDNLDILPIQIMTEHTAMAYSDETNPCLASILNKCILNLDEATTSSILIEYTFASPYHYTVSDFIYKFRTQIIIISILTIICFGLLISFAVVEKRNTKKLQVKNVLLADAVSQADRANDAKSQFLSRMSHEIRTPMNAIVGLTEIAKQHEKEPAKMDDYLEKIAVSSKVLLNIINDVLDMSAIESNKLKIGHSEFDLKQIINGISTIYYPQCQSKGVSLEMATDVQNEILLGDSLRVNQILLNLVSNAYKFTEAGGTIRIFVEETAKKDNTAFVRFKVSDTGCGMTEDVMERLFKPFEQETASTAKKHGGSGLGLSIAKNLADLMHGAIAVESEKGKGTTFTVDLPFEIGTSNAEMSSDTLKEIRVLTVDDDKASREYTSIVLQRIGVKYESASSGKEAISMIEAAVQEGHPYDVCLIDWKIPDMDGVELTRCIREKEVKKTLIIIVSAYDLNEAKDAGADHFVSKPLFQSTVFNVLMTLTGGTLREESARPEDYDFTGHRVLLAEDNEMNAEIATELLGMVHLEVERAENGQIAVDMFSSAAPGTYDAILMDVQMPVMDGYEAARTIRSLERRDAKEIQIYAMTANAFNEDVSAALSAGMNGHIAKPIDTKILYSTIKKTIANVEEAKKK